MVSVWRGLLSLSQSAFGAPFAATKQNVGRWESGVQRPMDATKAELDAARLIPAGAWCQPASAQLVADCMQCEMTLTHEHVAQCGNAHCPKNIFRALVADAAGAQQQEDIAA